MSRRRVARVALALVILLSTATVAGGWTTRPQTASAGSADGVTVVTQQGRDRLPGVARVVAFDEEGSMVYEDDRFGAYFDVDPVAGTDRTIEYVAVEFEPIEQCPDHVDHQGDWCARNMVIRANVTTGEREVVFTRFLPKLHKLHDVDRVNDTHLLVGNIYVNQVELVNTSSGEREWVWNANESFAYPESGGSPGDWTHLNDVELVRDGLVMVSLRNHDQVVFVEPGEGVVENLTLGCDGCHGVLFEQHNPDYVPAERGGPAVVVADSENHRIVQYQRRDGRWVETWTWTSAETAWPRDADLLPNGNTLVTDSHANRVVEVAPDGDVVWSVTLGNPYEAERLGTGDESAGATPHPPGRQLAEGGPIDRVVLAARGGLPPRSYSGLLFGMPYWVGLPELLAVVAGAGALALLVLLEVGLFLRGRRIPRPGALADVLDR